MATGGILTTIKERSVCCKIWIHFIIGDTSGNNRFAGQYNSSGNCNMPFHDCKCGYEDLSLSNPTCKYITPLDIKNAMTRRINAKSKTAGHAAMKAISKHPINNAFMSEGVPLSDNIHGIYRMLPPEKLHTTDEGITEHMISSLSDLI